MKRLAEIMNEVKVFYRNVEISSIVPISAYAQFIIGSMDSEESHTSALALHTGSIFYQAMTVALAAIACLSDKGTDVSELVASLNIGDLLLVDGKRSKFLGIKSGKEIGVIYDKTYFIYENSGITYSTPIEELKNKNIDIYNGNAVTLDGRGIKSSLQPRKKFLSFIFGQSEKSQISTIISRSVAILADREIAEDIYSHTKIKYAQNSVDLNELVTASFFTDNDDYQIGNNSSKEEPVIKFFSKVSVCRETIIADKQKRFLGCIGCDETIWRDNSEISDIAERKSLKFSLFIGKTHYTYYEAWLRKETFKYYIPVPETVQADFSFKDSRADVVRFQQELSAFSDRKITCNQIQSICSIEEMTAIKWKLLQIKNETPESNEKDNFLINSYFVINLCRSAFFPLKYYDALAENKSLQIVSLDERFQIMNSYSDSLIGNIKERAQSVVNQLHITVESLYQNNPKGNYIVSAISKRQIDCIVTTKAYYETVFLFWLKIEGLHYPIPQIMTVSVYEKASKIFDKAIFTTGYYDFHFNPYADFGFRQAVILCCDFENVQTKQLCKMCNQGKALIHERNSLRYDCAYDNNDEDSLKNDVKEIEVKYETDIADLVKELQINQAYRYAHLNSGSDIATTAEIKKILSFASGSVGYFTKQYKAYRLSADSASETELENLKIGDSLVFTKESENKDIVDAILQQLLETQYKNTQYPLQYQYSVIWKDKIRNYMQTNHLTYQDFADRLQNHGCKRHQVTVRSWLSEETHIVGPREEEDYTAIFDTIGFTDITPSEAKIACDNIRSLRMKILGLLGKAIVRNIIADNSEPLWSEILGNAERLSQTEQIISITTVSDAMRLPIYMVNKPCAI